MCLPFNIKVFKGKESSISRAGGSEENVFKGYVLKLGFCLLEYRPSNTTLC